MISLVIILPAKTALAQSSGLSISPPQIEILLQPSTNVIHAFNIRNQGETTYLVPKIEEVVPIDDYGHTNISPTPPNLEEYGLKITVQNNNLSLNDPFLLRKGEATQIVLRIESSPTQDPIDSYLALTLTPQTTNTDEPTTAPKIAALLFTSILPLDAKPIDLSLSNWQPPRFHDSSKDLVLEPLVTNNSASMIRPRGKITITNYAGTTIYENTLYPHLILSKGSRVMQSLTTINELESPETIILTRGFYLGPHIIELELTTESGKQLILESRSIFLIPTQIIIYVIVIIVLFATLFSQFKKSGVNSSF